MQSVAIDAASNGDNTVVAGVANARIEVVGFNLMAGGSVNAKFTDGPGGAELTGPYPFAANGGMSVPMATPVAGSLAKGWFGTSPGNALVLNLSGAVQVSGVLVYRVIRT